MKTACSAALVALVLASCAGSPHDDMVEVLVEARRTLVRGGDAELAPLRAKIEARCDNLIRAHQAGYRAALPDVGWDMRQGCLERTDRDLDLSIDGEGFFRVLRPDSTIAFTRWGRLELDAEGSLIIGDCMLDPPITIPQNITRVFIDTTGLVQGFDRSNPQSLQALGQLDLTRFPNPEKLEGDGVLFSESPFVGGRIDGQPGQGQGFGLIRQGFLESSNLDTIAEIVHLVEDIRRYRIALEAWRIKRELR